MPGAEQVERVLARAARRRVAGQRAQVVEREELLPRRCCWLPVELKLKRAAEQMSVVPGRVELERLPVRAKTTRHRARMVAPRTMQRLQVEVARMRAQAPAVRKPADLAELRARAVPRNLLRTRVEWMPAKRLLALIRRVRASASQKAERTRVDLMRVAQEPQRVEAEREPLGRSPRQSETCAGAWSFPRPFARRAAVRLVVPGAAQAGAELAEAR